MTDVEVLEADDRSLSLRLHEVSPSIANSLRRVSIAGVPSLAIDYVFFYENSSVINDDVLSHRLGLIPLTGGIDDYVPHEECDCGTEYGCPKCSVTLTLEAESTEGIQIVSSGDIVSQDVSVKPSSGEIPIVKLAPGDRLTVEMRALIGTGRQHAKWQPTSKAVVLEDNGASVLELESAGQMSPARILDKSVEIILEKLEELDSHLEEVEGQDEA